MSSIDVTEVFVGNKTSEYESALSVVKNQLIIDQGKTILMMKDIVSVLLNALSKCNVKTIQQNQRTIVELVQLIEDDSFLIDNIIKMATNTDARIRTFAAELVQYVDNPAKLRNNAFALTIDRALQVRLAILKSLALSKFDDRTMKTLVLNEAHDAHPYIRNQSIPLLIKYAPDSVKEFNSLLTSESTCATALSYIRQILENNSFRHFTDSFTAAAKISPEKTVNALVGSVDLILPKDEETFYRVAEILRHNEEFLSKLHVFYQYLENKQWICELLMIDPQQKWRSKHILCIECIKMAPLFKEKLVPHAHALSNDNIAIIRNQSVDLWIALFNETDIVDEFKKLLKGGWHQRLVAAKVIGKIGMQPSFELFAEMLSKDEVENVRSCLAGFIQGTPDFDKYFGKDCIRIFL